MDGVGAGALHACACLRLLRAAAQPHGPASTLVPPPATLLPQNPNPKPTPLPGCHPTHTTARSELASYGEDYLGATGADNLARSLQSTMDEDDEAPCVKTEENWCAALGCAACGTHAAAGRSGRMHARCGGRAALSLPPPPSHPHTHTHPHSRPPCRSVKYLYDGDCSMCLSLVAMLRRQVRHAGGRLAGPRQAAGTSRRPHQP